MASPSATVLCTAASSFRLAPNMVPLFFLAALLATPTRASSPSSNGAGLQPTATFCSGHSPAVTSSEVTRSFLAAVCAGAYGVAHMSHNMSSYVVAENRTMYGVAQCRPDVPVADCSACLAAASRLIIAGTRCGASAVWHDACFLRYSDRGDPSRFREDEYTVTVFNASRALSSPYDGKAKAVVRRLLASAGKSTMTSHMCSRVGAGTGTAASGGRIYGLTRCAAGISCDDCRRCLRGALAVVDRVYNGSAGMQVLRLSCMARYVAENRTMYGVAQCRPDVSVSDCAACLAASSKLIARTSCAASAVWHDTCFLRYSEHDGPGRFLEDEYTATVFNASRALSPHVAAKAVVRRLLAAAGNSTTGSHLCRSVGAATGTVAGGGWIYGLTQCAVGISCDDCRRCIRGAVAVVDRAYNGSAGMQVLRLSCMARYESYRFYNTKSLARRLRAGPAYSALDPNATAYPPPSPGTDVYGRYRPPPSPPAQARAPPPPVSSTNVVNATEPTPQPAAPALNGQTATGSSKTNGKGMSKWMIISLATGLTAIAAIILALTIWYCRKRRPAQRGHVIDDIREETMHCQETKHLSSEEDEDDEDGGRTSCQLYSYQVLEAATCHFSSRNKLGSGGFGTVYKGTLEDGKEVAVKRLRDSKRTIQELEREISIVANLRHKNLVRFLGYCFQEEGRFLIYEYVPNNSLDKFWYKASFQCEKLEWVTWFNIILGVARGLRFLHDKGIIHRDLKPPNVLLDDNFNPKIADFDLMRMYDKHRTHESTEKVAGTFGYMAPECTSGRKFLLSIKSDVYSYGVLVLEIITGHKIYTFEGQHSEGLVEYVWQHWTEKRASDVVDGDLGVEGQEHPARQALRCVHVALLCVQSDRAMRPTMGQVIAMLSSDEELPEPSLPGYVVRPTAASGVQLCFGCR